jgi:hypothetical protein
VRCERRTFRTVFQRAICAACSFRQGRFACFHPRAIHRESHHRLDHKSRVTFALARYRILSELINHSHGHERDIESSSSEISSLRMRVRFDLELEKRNENARRRIPRGHQVSFYLLANSAQVLKAPGFYGETYFTKTHAYRRQVSGTSRSHAKSRAMRARSSPLVSASYSGPLFA